MLLKSPLDIEQGKEGLGHTRTNQGCLQRRHTMGVLGGEQESMEREAER